MMINVQVSLLLLGATAVIGDLPPGSNRYLPVDPPRIETGYTYNPPPVTFPQVTRPTPTFPVTPTRPTPSYPTVPTRRPTSYPGSSVRPTPGFPDYSGSPSGHTESTLNINHDHGDHHDHHHHHEPGMPFDFNYAVKDDTHGNDYSHNAVSDGDIVRGEYRVQLPDGRLQIVQYTADWKHGFNAQVSYEGTPRYDPPRPTTTFKGY